MAALDDADQNVVASEFKPRTVHVTTAFVAVLFSFAGVVSPVTFLPEPFASILILPAIAAGLFFVVRSFRIALSVDDAGVRVRNYWRTYTLPWVDVERIGIAASSGFWAVGPSPAIEFVTRAPSRRVQAHATRWIGRAREKERLVSVLGAFARAHGVEAELAASRLQ